MRLYSAKETNNFKKPTNRSHPIVICLDPKRRQTIFFFDGHCSTVQVLLDWFKIDLGFTELSFIQIDLCVLCVFVLYSRVSLSSCPFLDILNCLPRAVGVPLESALNLVSRMSPCGAHDTHACCARSNDHLLYLL